MAWQRVSPKNAFDRIHERIAWLANRATQLRDISAAGTLTRIDGMNFATELRDVRVLIQNLLPTPGLDAYARTVMGATFDIAAEAAAKITAINDMQSWICGPTNAKPTATAGAFPMAVSGHHQATRWGVDGAWVSDGFTAAQTTGFRDQIDAFLAGMT